MRAWPLQEGYFDEHGHYVEYRLKADLRDAWLDEYARPASFLGNTRVPRMR
jgi:hypothetical protein